MKNGKIATINVDLKSLFVRWIEFTKPFHKLSDQHSKVLGELLYYNHLYSKQITDYDLVWKTVFSYDTKAEIKESLGIKDQHLQNILTALRKKGVIKNNQVINTYIPNLEPDAKSFTIVFNLSLKDG